MPDTFFLKFLREDTANFIIQSTPFLPIITKEGEGYKVKFNRGFVYDYANGATRIAVTADEFTLGPEESKTYYIKMVVGSTNGAIASAEIVDEEPTDNELTNLYLESTWEYPIQSDISQYDPQIYKIELAEISRGTLKELYVRENIHLWFRGLKQVGASYQGQQGAVMMGEAGAHELAKFRSIIPWPRSNNSIQVTTVGEHIWIYASDGTSSEDDDDGGYDSDPDDGGGGGGGEDPNYE